MTKRVVVIGGYGNFGSYIARKLSSDPSIVLVIVGRSVSKAQKFIKKLDAINSPEAACLDINGDIVDVLGGLNPDIVIHTSGPFQSQQYHVAEACLKIGCHYIDLADGRLFVSEISSLDAEAKKVGVLVCSGASSVPCLTSALIDKYKLLFSELEKIDYAIATAQQTNTGLATTSAVLSYAGKPFGTLLNGRIFDVYGWQGLRVKFFRGLGFRLLGYCDVPDLELFPKMYPEIKTIRFQAGLEIPVIHLGLWGLSWLVRWGLIKSLQGWGERLLSVSRYFDWLGTADSGFYMKMSGRGTSGGSKNVRFDLLALNGCGPYIPTMPAIILAKKLARGETRITGATPCVGLVTLDEYLAALEELDISWSVSG